MISRRTATISQIRASIEQAIVVRSGAQALRKSPWLYEDGLWLDEGTESTSGEIRADQARLPQVGSRAGERARE